MNSIVTTQSFPHQPRKSFLRWNVVTKCNLVFNDDVKHCVHARIRHLDVLLTVILLDQVLPLAFIEGHPLFRIYRFVGVVTFHMIWGTGIRCVQLTDGGSPAAATPLKIKKTLWPPSGAATCYAPGYRPGTRVTD